MNNQTPKKLSLGVTVMPEWFQCEGIDQVLDNLQKIGATALVTSPYLLEVTDTGVGAREPPPDGEAGGVRPLDRALWGRRETWVKTDPSLNHDLKAYAGLRYQPSPPGPLTQSMPDFMDLVIEKATSRGMQIYLQIMAASPPGYRVQFSGAVEEDQCRGPDGKLHPHRVDRNASLASGHVHAYGAALLAELAKRYPNVTGFRIDWPEYPPYDLKSALFDFSFHGQEAISALGANPEQLGWDLSQRITTWQQTAQRFAKLGAKEVMNNLLAEGWDDWLSAQGPAKSLWQSKRASVARLLQTYRSALNQVKGPHRLLEPQVFPQPMSTWSGFDWSSLACSCDAVGVKLYTMHWPMIARYWARDLIGTTEGPAADHLTQALFEWMQLGSGTDASLLRYPPPDTPHPAGKFNQIEKLRQAQAQAGQTPVIAFTHSYGPADDFIHRFQLAAQVVCTNEGSHRIWINRYGYLSEEKMKLVAKFMHEGGAT